LKDSQEMSSSQYPHHSQLQLVHLSLISALLHVDTECQGPLSGSFPLVSLCMSKSDVVVGVSSEVAEKLDHQDKTWRVNGRSVSHQPFCKPISDNLTPDLHWCHLFLLPDNMMVLHFGMLCPSHAPNGIVPRPLC
jgi:hypothetical protein